MELPHRHKIAKKATWKYQGLVTDNFEGIYLWSINCEQCEVCNKTFTILQDRQMDHNHKTGEFRDILCHKCNLKRADRNQKNNTSGYIGISKKIDKTCNQGYFWVFQVMINGKRKDIKSSINKEKLIEFAIQWKIDNNYNT